MATQHINIAGLGNVFATPPSKTKTYTFKLIANGAHAIVGPYAFVLRTRHQEHIRSAHELEVKLTPMPSGQDHAAITWQHTARGDCLGRHQIAHLLSPKVEPTPAGYVLFTSTASDPLAPWTSHAGKPRTGLIYFLSAQIAYRVGVDPFAENAAELRKAMEQLKANLQAIMDRNA